MAERQELTTIKTERETAGRKHPVLTIIEGHPKEIDVLQREVSIGSISYQEAAPRFRKLLEQNPEWAYLFEHFSSSPKHFVRLLVALYPERFMSYNHIYRLTSKLDIGESHMRINVAPRLPRVDDFQFKDTAGKRAEVLSIMSDFELESRFKDFIKDPQQIITQLAVFAQQESNEVLRSAYQRTISQLANILHLKIPVFKEEFQPRNYQSLAALKGLDEPNPDGRTAIGIFYGTRTGKTLAALARAEVVGARKVIVIAPAGAKRHWQDRINEYYIKPPDSVIIESSNKKAIEQASKPETKFVIVSYDTLIGRKHGTNGDINGDQEILVDKLASIGFDTVMVDESQNIKNFRNKVRRSFSALTLITCPSVKHIMLLSATPVDKEKDMDITAHILDSASFPALSSFSESFQGNPRLGHNALLSRMVRLKSDEVLDLPLIYEETIPVLLTPTQRALYDFVHKDESSHLFRKLKNLRAATIQPGLVKGIDISFDLEESLSQLRGIHLKYLIERRTNPNLRFDSDFLVKNGFSQLFISAHFSFKCGIDEFIKQHADSTAIKDWQGEPLPAKYQKIREIIREKLARGEKVIIFSSFFTRGITSDYIDKETEKEHFQSLYKFLQQEFGAEVILKMDGNDRTDSSISLPNGKKTSEREIIRKRWQEDSNARILLTNAGINAAIDLSISDPLITGVTEIYEGGPLSHIKFHQSKTRVISDTQKSPVTIFYLEAENTVDQEIYYLLEEKEKYESMLLDAVPLTEEEQRIFEDSSDKISTRLARMINSPRQNVSIIFRSMLGKSEDQVEKLLSEKFTSSQTYGEYLAEWYDEIFIEGTSGYASQIVRQIVEGLEKKENKELKIADWGSGPLILARTLNRPIPSLDISQEMLASGKEKLLEKGIEIPEEFIQVGSMSSLSGDVFKDEVFDIGVCSLALDCTQPGTERLKAIKEMRRCLAPGGRLIITIPESELDSKSFGKFIEGFKGLGLIDDLSLSGYVKGVNKKGTVFNSWLFVLKKAEEINENIDDDQFLFSFEKIQSSRQRRTERAIQTSARDRLKKSPYIDQFVVCKPDSNKSSNFWSEVGRVTDLIENSILRQFLDYSDQELQLFGFKREIVTRGGKQEIVLTRL